MQPSSRATAAMVLALTLPLASSAFAFGSLDGDNNPVPGASSYALTAPDAYASAAPDVHASAARPAGRRSHAARASRHIRPEVRNQAPPAAYASGDLIGETKADQPNAVFWRGRNVGTDPDPNIRLRLLRDAIGGGG